MVTDGMIRLITHIFVNWVDLGKNASIDTEWKKFKSFGAETPSEFFYQQIVKLCPLLLSRPFPHLPRRYSRGRSRAGPPP